jgi:hypothetical protein
MEKERFIAKVKAFNLLADTDLVQAEAKKLFPNCDTKQMGYDGGYSDVLTNDDQLTNWNGREIKNLTDDYFTKYNAADVAFGTIGIEIKEDEYVQLYHNGIGTWVAESFPDNYGQDIGSTENAIIYLNNLKQGKVMKDGGKVSNRYYTIGGL